MANNFLKLNDDKTDFIIIGSRSFVPRVECKILTVGEQSVSTSTSVKNIGASLDSSLAMETEIKAKCMSAWWQLYQISKIKRFLTPEQVKTVTVSLVLSKLDQNNSLLHDLPDCVLIKLQRVQNSAARLLCSAGRQFDAAPLLVSLHWLPIKKRIKFKIVLLVYKCLNGIGPLYLSELLSFYSNSESRQCLRFLVSAPKLWNSLPFDLRNSPSVESFKKSLKTFLF